MHQELAQQLREKGIRDEQVIQVMMKVRRQDFVSPLQAHQAYDDNPLPIGYGQTISQPYIVALMTEMLGIQNGDKVLEVGTGSGFQTAVLGALGASVYSMEIIPELHEAAVKRLQASAYNNVHCRLGDASHGWPEQAPFDALILTAAAHRLPLALIDHVKPGGTIVAPEGTDQQFLHLYEKLEDGGLRKHASIPVRFVPMTGFIQKLQA